MAATAVRYPRAARHLALRIAEFFDVPVEVVFSTRPFPTVSGRERSA
ncbi:MAG: hypothetical protein ACFCUP_15040 [Actinomycetales bacterium]